MIGEELGVHNEMLGELHERALQLLKQAGLEADSSIPGSRDDISE